MKLAISNIAWTAEHDASIGPRLSDAGANAIEVAPGRILDNVATAGREEAERIRSSWEDIGLPIVSMQALLFGRSDLRLFGDADEEASLLNYLEHVVNLAGALGCGPLVFGSPKNRLKGPLDFEEAVNRAVPLLRRVGQIAEEHGTIFCLEANARAYGCDFMTRLSEAGDVARAVDHPGVGLVLDTGNMLLEDETPQAAACVASDVRHLHFSAPNLGPVMPHLGFLSAVLGTVRDAGYDGIVTIEMLPLEDDDRAEKLVDTVSAVRALLDREALV